MALLLRSGQFSNMEYITAGRNYAWHILKLKPLCNVWCEQSHMLINDVGDFLVGFPALNGVNLRSDVADKANIRVFFQRRHRLKHQLDLFFVGWVEHDNRLGKGPDLERIDNVAFPGNVGAIWCLYVLGDLHAWVKDFHALAWSPLKRGEFLVVPEVSDCGLLLFFPIDFCHSFLGQLDQVYFADVKHRAFNAKISGLAPFNRSVQP